MSQAVDEAQKAYDAARRKHLSAIKRLTIAQTSVDAARKVRKITFELLIKAYGTDNTTD